MLMRLICVRNIPIKNAGSSKANGLCFCSRTSKTSNHATTVLPAPFHAHFASMNILWWAWRLTSWHKLCQIAFLPAKTKLCRQLHNREYNAVCREKPTKVIPFRELQYNNISAVCVCLSVRVCACVFGWKRNVMLELVSTMQHRFFACVSF